MTQSIPTGQNFHQMVQNLKKVSATSGLVMDERLQVVDKRGWKWRLLCLLRPFYSLFCRDVYSHCRVNKVTATIFKACEHNKGQLAANPRLAGEIQAALAQLNSKTKKKYTKELSALGSKVAQLAPRQQSMPPSAVKVIPAAPPKPQGAVPASASVPPVKPAPSVAAVSAPPAPPAPPVAPVETTPPAPELSSASAAASAPAVEAAAGGAALSPVHIVTTDLPCDRALEPKDFTKLEWPSRGHLSDTQIDLNAVQEVERWLNGKVASCIGASAAHKLRFVEGEGKLQLLDSSGAIQSEIATPLFFEIVYQGDRLQDIFLLTDCEAGEGAETTVWYSFSLFRGMTLARKTYDKMEQPLLHQRLLEHLRDYPGRGIVNIPAVIGKQTFEAFWELNLWDCIQAGESFKPLFAARLEMAIDILSGVAHIHGIKCDRYLLPDGTPLPLFKMFHSDLSFTNVLANPKLESETPPTDAVITDFSTADPLRVGGTVGFKDKDMVHLCLNYQAMTDREIAEYKIRYGQKGDVWSAGLLLAGLGSWTAGPNGAPPLPCIYENLQPQQPDDPSAELFADRVVKWIDQDEINQALQELKENSQDKQTPAFHMFWELVGEMLQVDSDKRCTIEGALQKALAIQKKVARV